jgi:hypothetical protein
MTTQTTELKIELSDEMIEVEEFKSFLEDKGHTVTIGRTNCCAIDSDYSHEDMYLINDLWEEYCNS